MIYQFWVIFEFFTGEYLSCSFDFTDVIYTEYPDFYFIQGNPKELLFREILLHQYRNQTLNNNESKFHSHHDGIIFFCIFHFWIIFIIPFHFQIINIYIFLFIKNIVNLFALLIALSFIRFGMTNY